MNWAMTGGSGYLAGALTEHLTGRCRDDSPRGEAVRLLSRKDVRRAGATVISGSLDDRGALEELVRGADVIVHLAAWVHRRTQTDEETRQCREVNVEGTRHLLDAAARVAPGAFVIFVSTANVYAESSDAIDESSPLAPRTPYGQSKLDAERLVLDAVARGAIRGAVVRPAMIFGVGSPGNLGRLARMVRRGWLPAIGGGTAPKTLVPVGKFVAAIDAVAGERERLNGAILNIGGEPLSMRRIAEVIAGAEGRRCRIVPVPKAPVAFAARIADALFRLLPVKAPGFGQLVATYTSPAVLDDRRLRALPTFRWDVDVENALREWARGRDVSHRSTETPPHA